MFRTRAHAPSSLAKTYMSSALHTPPYVTAAGGVLLEQHAEQVTAAGREVSGQARRLATVLRHLRMSPRHQLRPNGWAPSCSKARQASPGVPAGWSARRIKVVGRK